MNILIGNGVSFISACFTFAASYSKNTRRVYLYQALQCLSLAIANIFFMSISGTTTLILCAVRNTLVAYDKFTGRLCSLFLVLIVVCGLFSNNRGLIGLLPIIATLIYTVGSYCLKDPIRIKINIIVNLCFWMIYEICVHDFVSIPVDGVSAAIAAFSIFQLKDMERREN